MLAILFGGFGLIIGSFLNVLILREGTDEGINGRSHCMRCKQQLSAWELVPVLSWLALWGRCRHCALPISIQYPLVELLMGGLFVIVGMSSLTLTEQALALVIVAIVLAIAVYDIRHMLIPDLWNYIFIVTAFVYGLHGISTAPELFIHAVSGPFVAAPLFALWALSRGAWMGFGDVKFALGMGWLLGSYYGYIALTGGFIIGAVISVTILLPLPTIMQYAHRYGITRLRDTGVSYTMTSEVPFGPFLIASTLIVWFSRLYGIALPPFW